MKLRVFLAAAFLTGVSGSAPLAAQASREAKDVHLRNDCRLAVQVVETGRPHPRWEWALQTLPRCDESGPRALASVWSRLTADTAEVRLAVAWSARMRDQRLFDQAIAVTRDPARPGVVRIGAMILLMRYADPPSLFTFEMLAPRAGPARVVRGAYASPPPQLAGAAPLAPSVSAPVLAVLREVSANESDPRVRYAAGALARTLAARVEGGRVP